MLAEGGRLPDTAAGWRRYVAYLAVRAEDEARLRDNKFGRLSHGWVLGSAEFKDGLKKQLQEVGDTRERFELLGSDAPAHREVKEALWEEQLQRLARAFKTLLDRLPKQKSAPEKVRMAAALKDTTSVSNAWLAQRLEMGEPASVSQFVRGFQLSGGLASQRVLSKVNPCPLLPLHRAQDSESDQSTSRGVGQNQEDTLALGI